MPSVPGRRPPVLLELDLTRLPADPDPDDLVGRLRTRARPQLRPILRALHEAGGDRHVVGLIAKVGGALPWAAMQELRGGVAAFAASGKPTVAWAESFGEESGDTTAYALASAFGEIWLQPGGGLGMLGVGAETTFLRGALDKLGIEPQLEKRHEYKNAADRLMNTEFTEAHREVVTALTASVYDGTVEMIAAGRGLPPDRVRELIDTGPRTASEATEVGLIDRLGYRDEAYAALRSRVGGDPELLFADRWSPRRSPARLLRKGHVALVEVRGPIATGRTSHGALGGHVGSDTVGAALRAAGHDDHARAVLLHVDSPGGSAVASEVIWREVSRLRDAGKPVIVSMGTAAASGGYYVSCPADVIVAQPATLTGSIGVFGGKLVLREALERLGLTTGTVEQGERALMSSNRRRYTEGELERLSAEIDAIYADFVAKVAAGRNRPVAEIEPLARGRVWTGSQARERGLVDELGGLRTAATIARERGELPATAPIRRALHVPPLARLGRPRNSDDPRAAALTTLPAFADLAAALGLSDGLTLRMPPIRVR